MLANADSRLRLRLASTLAFTCQAAFVVSGLVALEIALVDSHFAVCSALEPAALIMQAT